MLGFEEYERKMKDVFARAGIPTKSITLTRVTVIVELFGEKHTEKVAMILRGAGWEKVHIFDNRPSIFRSENRPPWRVTGMKKFEQE